jgi:hypothetical protein
MDDIKETKRIPEIERGNTGLHTDCKVNETFYFPIGMLA